MNIIKADLNGKDLYHAFISGARKIISDKLYLNSINVFPVPDGDTGTNLEITMNHIISSSICDDSVDTTLQSIYDASLNGARGNSGMIFTSFINGLQNYVKGRNTLSMHEFAEALLCSVETAYKSVAEPVEGTMLTVLKDWAESIKENLPKVFHFGELIEKSLQDAKSSLARTRHKLDVLRKANVVDSGGKGIVDFIEGIVEFFRTGKEISHVDTLDADTDKLFTEQDIEERFCTEAVISGELPDAEIIRERLVSLGSSVVVAGGGDKARIHVHTNDPALIIKYAMEVGKMETHKIDDMKMQTEAREPKYRIALVTDSIADISKDILDRYRVHVIPLSLFIDGEEYLDKLSLAPSDFYNMVDKAKTFPTSSQPPVGKFKELFGSLKAKYDSIIGIFVASKLSGTYQNAMTAAKELIDTGFKIDLIDSKLNSGAQGLIVMKAAEMIHMGLSHEETVNRIKDLIPRAKIFVSVLSFEYMVKGGRVSPLKGMAAKLLNMKPIVSLDKDGKGIAFEKAFSVSAIENKIFEIIKKIHAEKRVISFSLVHAQAEDRAVKIAKKAEEITGIAPVSISEVSSIVGISSGRGAAAISLITER